MSTTDEEKRLTALQLAAVDQDALMPEDKRVEKTPEGPVLAFRGKDFRVQDEMDYMALMEWAASSDIPVDSPAGLIAIFHMLEGVVHPEDFMAFRAHARGEHAKPEEYLDFINAGIEAISARPTEGPEASADGSSAKSAGSTERSSAQRAKGSKR